MISFLNYLLTRYGHKVNFVAREFVGRLMIEHRMSVYEGVNEGFRRISNSNLADRDTKIVVVKDCDFMLIYIYNETDTWVAEFFGVAEDDGSELADFLED